MPRSPWSWQPRPTRASMVRAHGRQDPGGKWATRGGGAGVGSLGPTSRADPNAREVWLGKAALGKVLAQLGRDKEAEAQLTQATQTIEAIAANLQTPRLRHSFLNAAMLKVYEALGHAALDEAGG